MQFTFLGILLFIPFCSLYLYSLTVHHLPSFTVAKGHCSRKSLPWTESIVWLHLICVIHHKERAMNAHKNHHTKEFITVMGDVLGDIWMMAPRAFILHFLHWNKQQRCFFTHWILIHCQDTEQHASRAEQQPYELQPETLHQQGGRCYLHPRGLTASPPSKSSTCHKDESNRASDHTLTPWKTWEGEHNPLSRAASQQGCYNSQAPGFQWGEVCR